MSDGSASLIRRRSVSGGSVVWMSRWATWASACTPGVGPPRAVQLEVGASVASRMARSISPWMVLAFFWICQPL